VIVLCLFLEVNLMTVFSRTTISAFLLALLTAACASNADRRGDMTPVAKPQLDYTCRLETGEVLETTNREVAEDPSMTKARVFATRDQYGPRPAIKRQGSQEPVQDKKELRFFREVLEDKLSKATRGWKVGTARTVRVTAEEQLDVPENERTIRLARVKTVPKEMHIEKETFTQMTGSEAQVDETVYLHPEVKGKVVSVLDNEVVVVFAPVSDTPLDGPFGARQVVDKGDHWEIEIDAQVGRLVRAGPLLGRIAEVGQEMFRVDYSHPFGGETLECDVRVEAAPDDASEKITARLSEGGSAQSGHLGGSLPASLATGAEPVSPGPVGVDEKAACSERQAGAEKKPDVVKTGDLVEINYTAFLETGEVVRTTWPSVADSPDTRKVDWYEAPQTYGPETIVVGEKSSIPGLGDAVLGLGAGETKTVVLPPERAYGQTDVRRVKEYDRILSLPKTTEMSVEDYTKRYGGPPVLGRTDEYNPYVNGEVVAVGAKNATLALLPKAEKDESEIGTTDVKVKEDTIELALTPRIGAPFRVGDRLGRIISAGPKKFTVDYNHPMAGKKLVLDVEVISLTKGSSFKDAKIPWIEDHDQALEAAKRQGKPVVLVLYAGWCSWSKRYLSETLQDPRIRMLKDAFIWAKVDSGEQTDLKAFYGQKGFPMTVLLDSEGGVIKEIRGFTEASSLKATLDDCIQQRVVAGVPGRDLS